MGHVEPKISSRIGEVLVVGGNDTLRPPKNRVEEDRDFEADTVALARDRLFYAYRPTLATQFTRQNGPQSLAFISKIEALHCAGLGGFFVPSSGDGRTNERQQLIIQGHIRNSLKHLY
jgi:hypothetical protein